jgi:hypothetical protein
MIENKESFRLLYQAISELAAEMGDNQFETKSISLIFLDLDIEHAIKASKFLYEIDSPLCLLTYCMNDRNSLSKYSCSILALIEDKMPRDLSLHIKHKIIIGFANNYLPELNSRSISLFT